MLGRFLGRSFPYIKVLLRNLMHANSGYSNLIPKILTAGVGQKALLLEVIIGFNVYWEMSD